MSESNLTIPFDTIRREVGRLLGYQRDPNKWQPATVTDVNDIIASGLRMFTFPPPLRNEEIPHVWSWLHEEQTLTTDAPYSTGTISATNGTVTLTGGTWPNWAADGHLVYNNAEYEVATRTSDSVIVLADTSVTIAAGATYTLGHWVYELPDSFASMDSPVIYEPRNTFPWREIKETDALRIHELRQPWPVPNYPQWFAIRPQTFDATTGQRYDLLLVPTPNAAYHLRYRCTVNPVTMDATNLYYRGGLPHSETIREAILAAAEQTLLDNAGMHTTLFMQRMAGSVGADRARAMPQSLGQDMYLGDAGQWPLRFHLQQHITPTYNGQ